MAEVTGLRNNALPFPVYGAPWGIVFPLLDADGDPVSPSSPDSEISKNGDTFTDCTNEATEIATSSGSCYLLLTATEMTADVIVVQIKSTGAKTTIVTLYPRKLVQLRSGTVGANAGDGTTLQLDSGASAVDDFYNGALIVATIDSVVEARMISDYTGSSKVCSITPAFNTAPDNNDTFVVYLTEAMQINQANVTHIAQTAQTARDIGASVLLSAGTGTGQLDFTSGVVKGNVTQFGGSNGTFASGRPEVNMTHIAGSAVNTSSAQLGVNIVNAAGTAWGSGAITAASIASNAITSAKIAANAIGASQIADNAIDAGAIASNAITATKIASDAITAAKIADGAIDAATFAAGAIDASAIATDAIGALELAAGAASEIASAVRTELATELGRVDVAISTRLAGASYTAPLDAAGTRSAVGLASANLDTQLSGISNKTTNLPSDPADASDIAALFDALPTAAENATAVRTELGTELGRIDAAISTRLADADYSVPFIADEIEARELTLTSAYDAAKTAAQAGDAMTLTGDYDFAKGTVAMTEAYAANGVAPTPIQAMFAIHQMLMQHAISGTTWNAYKLNNVDVAFAVTLDDGTSPTSARRT